MERTCGHVPGRVAARAMSMVVGTLLMRCVLPPEQLNHVLPEKTFWNEHVVMFLAGWRHLCRRRSVTDQHQRLLEYGISSALALFETFLHRPDGTLCAPLFGLQGGGLYIRGTATLINTNVYSNQAYSVRSLSALA